MELFNIRKTQYAKSLKASGFANRWNKQDEFVIYSSSSISLAMLELLVHRAQILPDASYSLLSIEANINSRDILTLDITDLPKNWKSIQSYPKLQDLGSKWYQGQKEILLKVPSAVNPKEFNFLINTRHPDFDKKIKIKSREVLKWDNRFF